jgi:hypothetical protein
MGRRIRPGAVYAVSNLVVARKIEKELILIPVEAGERYSREAFYTLNPSAQAIWKKINGRASLKDIAAALSADFNSPREAIEKDVDSLVGELLKRKFLVEVSES